MDFISVLIGAAVVAVIVGGVSWYRKWKFEQALEKEVESWFTEEELEEMDDISEALEERQAKRTIKPDRKPIKERRQKSRPRKGNME